MHQKGILILLLVVFAVLVVPASSWSQMSNEELLQELKLLKERVKELERMIQQRTGAGEEPSPQEGFVRIRPEEERATAEIRDAGEEEEGVAGFLSELGKRVTINGLLEVEASYSNLQRKGNNRDEKTPTLHWPPLNSSSTPGSTSMSVLI